MSRICNKSDSNDVPCYKIATVKFDEVWYCEEHAPYNKMFDDNYITDG